MSDHLLGNPQARPCAQAELREDIAGSCAHTEGQASDEITRRALNACAQIEADRVGARGCANAPKLSADFIDGLIPPDRCQVAAHPLHRFSDSSSVRNGTDALGGHVADEPSADRVVAVGVQSHDAVVGDLRFQATA